MGSLIGFHPPHFSEEDAWLPPWLQRITQSSPHPSFQEIPQTIRTENGDEGRCMSFRLYLSQGEDPSLSIASINHEIPYRLCLSTNEESQYSLNPLLTTSQAVRFKFNEALLVHGPDANIIPEDTHIIPNRQKGDLGVPREESVSMKDQKRINPKADARSRKLGIKDAIELAVAASEALTIHDVLKDDEPTLKLSVASSVVLEAAIRVKQARLEELGETLTSSIEESNELDFCSDLDELTMADAYEDVGLTVANNHGDLSAYGSISHVKDSFASESYISSDKQKCNERSDLDIDSLKQQHKHVTKEHVEYEVLGLDNADLACDIDPVFSCSVEQAGLCMTEREGFAIGDLSSSKTIFRSTVHHGSFGYNEREEEEEDKMTNLVPERFQSRWFGGWTWKNEDNIPAVINDKYKRSIPEVFGNEVSSLSESADIAPDQNSCVQRCDKECNNVSQSSIALEHTYEKGSNRANILSADVAVSPSVDPECTNDKVARGNLVSDDMAATPDMSPLEPLCSVVPCSFNSDNVASQNCEKRVNLEKNSDPMAEPNLDNNLAKRVSPQNEGRSCLEVNGEVRRRHATSLKTYSMLYPRCGQYLDKERTRDASLPMQTPALDTNNGHDQAAKGSTSHVDKEMNLPMAISKYKSYLVPGRKRVRFSEAEISFPKTKKFKTPQTRFKDPSISNNIIRRLRSCNLQPKSRSHKEERGRFTGKTMLFQDLKFLLTGFSVKKHKQIMNLIQKNGGVVVDDIPSPPSKSNGKRGSKYNSRVLPLVLCPRRLLTTKFLYGCAVSACILKVSWLFDSLDNGSILPPNKYIVVKEHASEGCMVIGNENCCIFDNVAIMLHGKPDFYTKMANVIKHGGGLVFKSFHWLVKSLECRRVSVAAIVLEDENVISRQLKQCALERNIPMISFNWIVNCLYAGRLIPSPQLEFFKASNNKLPMELSEEI